MHVEFKLRLSRLKKVISEIKKAFIKNDSIPIIFNDYMGQIILMRGKIATINSLLFMTRDLPIKIDSNLGICVPDEFLKYIDKVKVKGENEYVFFTLDGNTLYVNIELKDSKLSTIYTVKVIENADTIVPEPNTSEIENIPDKMMAAIDFCSGTVKKSKDVSPYTLVWCHGNTVFSTNGFNLLSKVDLEQGFISDFSLSQKAISILSGISVDSYAVDNRYAFFYSSSQVIGIRQYNFETPHRFCESVDGYVPEYKIRIPYEVKERLPEIATMNDKKKSPNVEIIESGGLMSIISSASSKKGIKNDIIFEAKSANEIAGELHIGMFFTDFQDICKKSMLFTVDEQQFFLNVSLGDFGEFNYYLRLHDKVG